MEWPDETLFPEHAVECTPRGDAGAATKPFEAVLDKLVQARQNARTNKDFAKSDLLRDLLVEAGVTIEDTPKGPRWKLG